MYDIGDKFRPVGGRHFGTIVYTIINKITTTSETLYTIEQIGYGKHIIENISEDTLNINFKKICNYQ
jgi:hypothetical protein